MRQIGKQFASGWLHIKALWSASVARRRAGGQGTEVIKTRNSNCYVHHRISDHPCASMANGRESYMILCSDKYDTKAVLAEPVTDLIFPQLCPCSRGTDVLHCTYLGAVRTLPSLSTVIVLTWGLSPYRLKHVADSDVRLAGCFFGSPVSLWCQKVHPVGLSGWCSKSMFKTAHATKAIAV